jgi:hypothetical protein
VTAHEGSLKLHALLGGNVLRGKGSKASRDPVVRSNIISKRFDDGSGRSDRVVRGRIELDEGTVPRDGNNIVDAQGAYADCDGRIWDKIHDPSERPLISLRERYSGYGV